MARYGTKEYYEEELAEARRTGDRRREASALGCLGNLDYSRAIEYHHQALGIYEQLGDEAGIHISYKNLGAAYRVVLNDPYTALQMYQCSLAHTQNPVQQKDVLRRIEEIEREINI